MNASTRAHTNGRTSGSRRRRQRKTNGRKEKSAKGRCLTHAMEQRGEERAQRKSREEQIGNRSGRLLHPPPLWNQARSAALGQCPLGGATVFVRDGQRIGSEGLAGAHGRRSSHRGKSDRQRVFKKKKGWKNLIGKSERSVWMRRGEGLQKNVRDVREGSRMFGDVRRRFGGWRAPSCGWLAPSCGWLALPLLRPARQGKCRHNSFGFGPAGKAEDCNSEEGVLMVPALADAD